MKFTDYIVVLWSPRQGCFHVETVGDMLDRNYDILARQSVTDFIVLRFVQSQNAAHAAVEELKKELNLVNGSGQMPLMQDRPAEPSARPKCPKCGKPIYGTANGKKGVAYR